MQVNYFNVISVILLSILLSSCTGNKSKSKINNGTSTNPIAVNSQPQRSTNYTFYIPNDGIVDGILVIMDPHGSPNLVMDSLHKLADIQHLALIGMKEIENGIANYNSIINRDLQHFILYKKFKTKKVFLLGFSGAARMALKYSERNRIDGLILCGAGLQRQTQLPFPVVMVSGLSDFNFMEQYYNPSNPRTFKRNSIAIHFKGKHQWPPVKVLNDAIKFIIERNTGSSNAQSEHYALLSKNYYVEKEYFLSFKSMEVAYKLSINDNLEKMRKALINLSQDNKVKEYFNRLNLYITEEQKRYQMLSKALEIQDLNWWNNQINYMESKTNGNKNSLESESYLRTMAYMGILLYSRLNAVSVGRGRFDLYPSYLSIYEKLEPENPDLFFFKGVYAYTQGNQQEAIQDLQKSLALGFNDKKKMRKYFSQDFLNKIL